MNKAYPFAPIPTPKGQQPRAIFGHAQAKSKRSHLSEKSLNECRCCRLTGGTNSPNPLRTQDLSIVGHVDPDNSYKTNRLTRDPTASIWSRACPFCPDMGGPKNT